jgi:hypothetical protein
VRLDLRTGQYAFTARAPRSVCNQARHERPVRTGRLDAGRLAAVRIAYSQVLTDGFISPACQNGRRPDTIVVDNGGTPILVVTTGAWSQTPPDDLSCWSEAANRLQHVLDSTFRSIRRR